MKTIAKSLTEHTYLVEMSEQEHWLMTQLGRAHSGLIDDASFNLPNRYLSGDLDYTKPLQAILAWTRGKFLLNEMQSYLSSLEKALEGEI